MFDIHDYHYIHDVTLLIMQIYDDDDQLSESLSYCSAEA